MARPHSLFFILFLLSLLILSCTNQKALEGDPQKKIAIQEISTKIQKPLISGLSVGNLAPNATLLTIDGKQFFISSFSDQNKPVLLYFFTTWCPYCTEDFTTLSTLYSAYESDVLILAIDMDLSEDGEEIKEYSQKFPKLGSVFFARGNENALLAYQIRFTTTKYAIGRNGTILYSGSGAFSSAQWFTLLNALSDS